MPCASIWWPYLPPPTASQRPAVSPSGHILTSVNILELLAEIIVPTVSGIPAEAHPGRASAKLAADPQHASRLLSHNAKVPINRLPGELLLEIFYVHKLSSALRIGLTHVCHHWRELALTSPLLWTAICLEDRVEFVDACLRRSAVAPLTIVSRCYIEDELALMKFIAPHIGRIRALDLRSLSTSAAEALMRQSRGSKASMESVTLHVHPGCRSLTTPTFVLARNSTRQLRSLSLGGIAIAAPSSPLTALTRLDLTDTFLASTATIDDILDLLENCPRLETLSINERCRRFPVKSKSADRRVSISNLRHMRLAAHTALISGLLSCIILPSDTTLEIKCLISTHGVSPASIRTVLPDGLGGLGNLAAIRSLHVFVSSNIFRIRAYDMVGSAAIKKLDMDFDNDPPADMSSMLPQALVELARSFTSRGVRDLQIVGDYGLLIEGVWREVFAHLPYIQHIEIGSRGTVNKLFAALLAPSSADATDPSFCRDLRRIYIRGAQLDVDSAARMSTLAANRLLQNRRLDTLALSCYQRVRWILHFQMMVKRSRLWVSRFQFREDWIFMRTLR
ncbi:predicted protein [Postia placenta Mad-698-R]|nr:predicted protein [Postia placenta Mad-698-R]